MFCWKCGKQIDGNCNFCNFCGAAVASASNVQQSNVVHSPHQGTWQQGMPKTPQKNVNGWLIALGIAVLALSFVIVILVAVDESSENGLFDNLISNGDTPSNVVRKAYNALLNKDFETYLTYLYEVPEASDLMLAKVVFIPFAEKLVEEFGLSVVNVEIQNERIFNNGEKAEVIVILDIELDNLDKFELDEYFKEYLKNGITRTEKVSLVNTNNGWKIISD